MLDLRQLEYVQRLIDGRVEEGLTLEYKSSFNDRIVAVAACAFANSLGGQLVLGVREKDKIPVEITWIQGSGIEERIQNILRTAIQPGLTNVQVKPIQNPQNRSEAIYVVTVYASPEAPHMRENRYYGRHGSTSVPMENHDVRAAIVSRGRIEGLLLEIESNIKLAKQTIDFYDKLMTIPSGERQSVAFIPFYTDAWKSMIMSGLATSFEREAFGKF